jgi:hypothetical protein
MEGEELTCLIRAQIHSTCNATREREWMSGPPIDKQQIGEEKEVERLPAATGTDK